jgi:hypothetical protein
MRISINATIVIAALFAAMCLGFAIVGFTSLGDITDPKQLADAKGFAWFWVFLGSVAIALGLVTWWIAGQQSKDEDA